MQATRKARVPMAEQIRLINECRRSGMTDADWWVPSIVLRKFNSGYNRLAASDLDGRLASRLQCTCLGLDARRTVRYRPAGGCGPLFLEN